MAISKLDAARIQIDSAIDHYFQNDHVCAVTLAGAAEDILAGLLDVSGQQTAFEFLHDWYQENFSTTVSKKEFSQRMLNQGRNWLKHADKEPDSKFEITERDSIVMLMRAIGCFQKLTKKRTEKMENFYRYWEMNKTRINELFS